MNAARLGDGAWVFACEKRPSRAMLDAVERVEGVQDVCAAEREILCVFRDEVRVDESLIAQISAVIGRTFDAAVARRHALRVVYDGEDLSAVAAQVGGTARDVVEWHSEPEYEVVATGFAPGWAYLAETHERLRVARRRAPRERVRRGSVAIADARTGIYPFDGPGGWNLLGAIADEWRAFDPQQGAALALGDRVRFIPCEARRERSSEGDTARITAPEANARGLRVEWSEAPALVQDGGRVGFLRAGIARGGALWKGRLALANRALSQRWDAAALELYGAARVRAEGRSVRVSIDGVVHALRDGESLTIARGDRARVRYLAVEGGVACTPQLGGRGQLLRAAIGGLDYGRERPVRRGDLISCADPSSLGESAARCHERGDERCLDEDFAIELHEGRSSHRFARDAFERFVKETHAISAQSDRIGARLLGAVQRADRDTGASAVMVAGAIQVSADETPIVLGVDHPTVGGYPVLAVVALAHVGPLLARRPGALVRYRLPL